MDHPADPALRGGRLAQIRTRSRATACRTTRTTNEEAEIMRCTGMTLGLGLGLKVEEIEA